MSEGEKLISDMAAKPLGTAGEVAEAASSASQGRRIGHWVALFLFLISGIALAPWMSGASETNPAGHTAVPQAGDMENAASTSAPSEQAVTYTALVNSGEGAVLSASAPDYGSLSGNNPEEIIDSVVQTAAEFEDGIGNGRFGASGSAGGSAARGSGGGLPPGAGFPSASSSADGLGTGGRSGSSASSSPTGSISPTRSDSPTEENPDSAPPLIVAALPLEDATGPEPGKDPGPITPLIDDPRWLLPDPGGPLPPDFLLPAEDPVSTGPGPHEPLVAIAAVPTPGTALLIILAFPLLLFFRRRIAPQRH